MNKNKIKKATKNGLSVFFTGLAGIVVFGFLLKAGAELASFSLKFGLWGGIVFIGLVFGIFCGLLYAKFSFDTDK